MIEVDRSIALVELKFLLSHSAAIDRFAACEQSRQFQFFKANPVRPVTLIF